jgi:hypothetical protein
MCYNVMPPKKTPVVKSPASTEPVTEPEIAPVTEIAPEPHPVFEPQQLDGEVGSVSSSGSSAGEDDEYFEEDADMFDPMHAFSQLLVTEDGLTIPDTIMGVKTSLDTIAKLLNKLVKITESK